MKTNLTIDMRIAKRIAFAMVAAFLVAASSPLFQPGTASAALLDTRSIKISDASPSGTSITSGVGSGTGVTYRVTFTPSATAQSLIIDFCNNDPIINDTCTALTPSTALHATGVAGVSGTAGGTGWTLTANDGQVKLASDAAAPHNIVGGVTQVFDITGMTNPSTVGTFFARVYTYANNTWGTYSSPAGVGAVGNYVDYGGMALSTTNVITITARVQESLTFCVTKANPSSWTSHDCTDTAVSTNLPSLTIGHGSATLVLEPNAVDTGTIYSQLSTNATHGAIIRIRNSNLTCAGLSADNGTTCAIPSIDATSGHSTGVAGAIVAGTAAFGLYADDGVQDVNGVGATAADAAFHNAAHTPVTAPTDVWYGMNNGVTNGVTGTFGAAVAASTGPTYRVNNTYIFAATSALTTPAGIYTANLSMIATGTF